MYRYRRAIKLGASVTCDLCDGACAFVDAGDARLLYCYILFCTILTYGRWNCDFSKVGRCPLRRINELEVAVLQVLQYNVRVASSLFARCVRT